MAAPWRPPEIPPAPPDVPGRQARFRPTLSAWSCAGASLVLLLAAIAFHRPAAALLAAPLLADLVFHLSGPVTGLIHTTVTTSTARLREGDAVDIVVHVTPPVPVAGTPRLDLIATRVDARPLLRLPNPPRTRVQLAEQQVTAATASHFGRAVAATATVMALAAHGLLRAGPLVVRSDVVDIEPRLTGFTVAGPVARVSGWIGQRPSRRPGSGGDVVGVRPFVVGDRLRRVNWPATARHGGLHVTETAADREAAIVIVLDTTSDAPDLIGGGAGPSLDRVVRGAADLARRHLHAGDRIAVIDLAHPAQVTGPGNTRRFLDTVIRQLLTVGRQSPGRLTVLPDTLRRHSRGAVVVAFSPLLRDNVATALGTVARLGFPLVVVHTLPYPDERASRPVPDRWRLLQLDDRLDRLRHAGVVVVGSADPAAVDRAMLGLQRRVVGRVS